MAGVALAQDVQQPGPGSAARKAILDGLRENPTVRKLGAEWKAKITFSHVTIRLIKDWAWVGATPSTEDGKQNFESLTVVMHEKSGRWQVGEFTTDEIASADDPAAEYRKWRSEFLRRHPDCPERILPAKLD